jgi:hypothetical protein
MKRVQINSRTSTTNVLLTYPTLDANKWYQLTVEKLMCPALDSLILNKTLFTVERRLITGSDMTNIPPDQELELETQFTTFTPQNIRTVSQLVFQMNLFFREMCRRLATVVSAHNNLIHQFPLPAEFVQQNVDWYTGLLNSEAIESSLQAVFRSDGKIGFSFSPAGLKMFVLRLTDEGMRIFAHTKRYIALDAAGTFNSVYSGPNPIVEEALIDLPAAVTDSFIYVADNSLFSHVDYRHELVLQTSLPLDNTVECDTNRSFYKRQLASYNFPSSNASMDYNQVMLRSLVESYQTQYVFEDSIKTHNSFIVNGTELQNFNLYLINRNYTFDGSDYVQKDVPYDLHENSFYTVQFAVKPIK